LFYIQVLFTGFSSALREARQSANNNKYVVPLTFEEKRTRRTKMILNYKNTDEPITDLAESFSIDYFNVIIN
jgi:hypothetical protein